MRVRGYQLESHVRSAVPRFRHNVRCDTFFFELRLRCFEQRKNLRSQVIRSRSHSFALG